MSRTTPAWDWLSSFLTWTHSFSNTLILIYKQETETVIEKNLLVESGLK
jgi:hypothetical protein